MRLSHRDVQNKNLTFHSCNSWLKIAKKKKKKKKKTIRATAFD